MKRPLLFFCLLWCLLVPLAAQVGDHRSDFAVGVNGGYLLNRMSFSPNIKQSWKGGTTFGITVRYTCEKYLSAICALQAELNYADMGWTEFIETSSDTYSRSMHFVQLPLLARLGWGREGRGLQGFFQLGPQLNYCFAETEHFSDPWAGAPRPNNITAQYGLAVQNRLEYGITAGGGMEISTAAGHFLLDARYYYGLSDIFHNGKKDPFGRSANGAIVVKLTYLFDLMRTRGAVRR